MTQIVEILEELIALITQGLYFILPIFFCILAYWHRDRWLYVIAGLGLMLLSFNYFTDTGNWYFGILAILFGVYCFFKAAWDRRGKI